MARINIEDSLLRDERFFKLAVKLGSRECAVGALYFAWDLAQKWWWRDDGRIPIEEWNRLNFASAILDSGLAQYFEGKVYVCGSESQFAWIKQRKDAGKQGGLKKAMNLATASDRLAKPSKTYTSSSSSTSPSSSTSTSKEKTIAQADARASVRFDFEQIYRDYPRRVGKARGLKICKSQIKTEADFEALQKAVEHYTNHVTQEATESKFIKHFSTFMGEWRDWVDPETGTSPKRQSDWIKEMLEEEKKNAVR